MQVDPADLRFTQLSVGLYFKHPFEHFSIREAVRRLSRNEMTSEQFPRIRVILYGGRLWSVDNRRLWVFRFARCSSISVQLLTGMHPRLEELISDSSMMCMMREADFFPRVRHRGEIDWDFSIHFPEPSSFRRSRNSSNCFAMPPTNGGGEIGRDVGRHSMELPSFQGPKNPCPTKLPTNKVQANAHAKDDKAECSSWYTAVWNFFDGIRRLLLG
ncbi:unnamed protein product [Calypogeia fissa]